MFSGSAFYVWALEGYFSCIVFYYAVADPEDDLPAPWFLISYENEIILSQRDQII